MVQVHVPATVWGFESLRWHHWFFFRPFEFAEHCSLSPLRGCSFGGDRLDPSLSFQV